MEYRRGDDFTCSTQTCHVHKDAGVAESGEKRQEEAEEHDTKKKAGLILRSIAKRRFGQCDSVPCEVIKCLYIGSIGSASREDVLRANNIKHVLTLCDDAPERFEGICYTAYTGFLDSSSTNLLEVLQPCCDFISEGRKTGGVLVHCFQGKSRSAAVVAAYLIREYGCTVEQALDLVRIARPRAQPNLGFLAQLRTWGKRCAKSSSS